MSRRNIFPLESIREEVEEYSDELKKEMEKDFRLHSEKLTKAINELLLLKEDGFCIERMRFRKESPINEIRSEVIKKYGKIPWDI